MSWPGGGEGSGGEIGATAGGSRGGGRYESSLHRLVDR